ncbi:MAG: hypothetical protein HRT45_19140, partial [Bdellovibrionales bacterium]|nr:hypothetical protein [Bdellovibrionales bacterium]
LILGTCSAANAEQETLRPFFERSGDNPFASAAQPPSLHYESMRVGTYIQSKRINPIESLITARNAQLLDYNALGCESLGALYYYNLEQVEILFEEGESLHSTELEIRGELTTSMQRAMQSKSCVQLEDPSSVIATALPSLFHQLVNGRSCEMIERTSDLARSVLTGEIRFSHSMADTDSFNTRISRSFETARLAGLELECDFAARIATPGSDEAYGGPAPAATLLETNNFRGRLGGTGLDNGDGEDDVEATETLQGRSGRDAGWSANDQFDGSFRQTR